MWCGSRVGCSKGEILIITTWGVIKKIASPFVVAAEPLPCWAGGGRDQGAAQAPRRSRTEAPAEHGAGRAQGGALTCSNSSVMVLGSSCLWNHIMYLVWNRHDCFFRALAARYCAFVPWGRKCGAGDQGAPKLVGRGAQR